MSDLDSKQEKLRLYFCLKLHLNIWEFPLPLSVRLREWADSRLARSRTTGCSPAASPADWTPAWNRPGPTSRTAGGRRAPASATGHRAGELHAATAVSAGGEAGLTVALCCFMTASGGPSASRWPLLIRPTWRQFQKISCTQHMN